MKSRLQIQGARKYNRIDYESVINEGSNEGSGMVRDAKSLVCELRCSLLGNIRGK